jgi:hypothetical protein
VTGDGGGRRQEGCEHNISSRVVQTEARRTEEGIVGVRRAAARFLFLVNTYSYVWISCRLMNINSFVSM